MDTQASDVVYTDGKARTAGTATRKTRVKTNVKPSTAEDCFIGDKSKSRNRHLRHFSECQPTSMV